MDWRALLAPTSVIAPWLGGRVVHTPSRVWTCDRPRQWGWYRWTVKANTLTRPTAIDAPGEMQLESRTRALLVGDNAWDCSMPYTQRSVPLPPEGLPPFSVVEIGRLGPNYFVNRILFDTEVEEGVRIALGEERDDIEGLVNATPAHRAAFSVLTLLRKQQRALAAATEKERTRQEAMEKARKAGGTPEGRRELAKIDFAAGCRAALAVSGAQYTSHRFQLTNVVVDWLLDGRPFQCVVDMDLRIVEAGICLTDHDTGRRWDSELSLETLPSVVLEAQKQRKLVVFRHVD